MSEHGLASDGMRIPLVAMTLESVICSLRQRQNIRSSVQCATEDCQFAPFASGLFHRKTAYLGSVDKIHVYFPSVTSSVECENGSTIRNKYQKTGEPRSPPDKYDLEVTVGVNALRHLELRAAG